MLQRYPILYLKPANGSLGGGIIRLIRQNGRIIYQSTTPSGTLTRLTHSLYHMNQILKQRIKKQSYLIQQGLNLVKCEGRPVDFRVLVQKNRSGNWTITSAVGRIANNQHIVSNLAKGGTIRKASDLLKELKQIRKPSISQLRKKALEIAKTFESLADGHFAELGIDLAIDQKGDIWLLEINSKPSKTDDSMISSTNSTRPSVYRLMEYTHFLTGLKEPTLFKTKKSFPTFMYQRRTMCND
jgi:glutathione synthase/RimK-type ligase-like ATP-grasp enzyme